MATLEASIIINCPIEEAFKEITNFKQHPNWRNNLLKAEITSSGPVSIGSTYTYDMQVMGRKIETTGIVVDYQPPKIYAWKATSVPFPLSGKVICEELTNGTQVSETILAELGGFFKLAEPVLLRQQKVKWKKI